MRTVTRDRYGKGFSKCVLVAIYMENIMLHEVSMEMRGLKKVFGNKRIDVDIDLCEDCANELAERFHIDDNNSGDV